MPRVARATPGGYPQHVLNRAVMRMRIFKNNSDYILFEELLKESVEETDMRILAYCIMPNHWHLLLNPKEDNDLSTCMHKLTNAHTRRVHALTRTIGTGPLYQGRYKSFMVEDDKHLLTVLKYIERNAVRAGLVDKAEDWQWGSAWRRVHGSAQQKKLLSELPTRLPHTYRIWVNTSESTETLASIRSSVNKGRPFGQNDWLEKTVEMFNLGQTLRNPGRPK